MRLFAFGAFGVNHGVGGFLAFPFLLRWITIYSPPLRVGLRSFFPSSMPKSEPKLKHLSPGTNRNGNTSSPSATSPGGGGIMSNHLWDPDSLLTPGRTVVDLVNGVLIGLNHPVNGFNGPKFILFPMLAIANDRLRYSNLNLCSRAPTFAHSQTNGQGKSTLRFPQIPPFSAPATLLHLQVSHHLPWLWKPITFSVRRVEGS